MHGHQVRRRRRGDEPEAERRVAGEPPLLQRGVSNRAVVQRLAYKQGQLVVPPSYGDRRIPWNFAEGYEDPREATDEDLTFAALVTKVPAVKKKVEKELTVKLEAYPAIKSVHDSSIVTYASGLVPRVRSLKADADDAAKAKHAADKQVQTEMADAVAAAMLSPNRVLDVPEGPFATIAAIRAAQRFVLDDFLPGKPDLSPKGTDLKKKIIDPEADPPQAHWTFACVLIALFKDSGLAKTIQLTKKPALTEKEVQKAVYALHDYYVDEKQGNLQYDDSGARSTIMNDWGYTLLWAGNSTWKELPGQVALTLKPGKYVIDIAGHTLLVQVLKKIKADTKITDIAEYFVDLSEKDNWQMSRTFGENVRAIWKK